MLFNGNHPTPHGHSRSVQCSHGVVANLFHIQQSNVSKGYPPGGGLSWPRAGLRRIGDLRDPPDPPPGGVPKETNSNPWGIPQGLPRLQSGGGKILRDPRSGPPGPGPGYPPLRGPLGGPWVGVPPPFGGVPEPNPAVPRLTSTPLTTRELSTKTLYRFFFESLAHRRRGVLKDWQLCLTRVHQIATPPKQLFR